MNFFNNTLIITALLTLPFISARQVKTRKPGQKSIPTPIQTKAPALPAQDEAYRKGAAALPAKTYKQLHDDIKILKTDQVINQNGLLTDYFIAFVKNNAQKSALADALTQALLQTGVHLHAKFSGDNEKDTRQLSAVNQQIANIMSQLKTPAQQELEKIKPVPTAPTKAIPAPAKQEKKQPEPIIPPQSKQAQTQPTLPEPKTSPSEPIAQPKKPGTDFTVEKPIEQKKLPSEPVVIPQSKEAQGIAALQNFRKTSAAQPMSTFYANARVNEQWLLNGLQLVLNGAQLSPQNKAQMQGELVGNATELMREFLDKNKIDPQLHRTFLDNVKTQTINFINKQLPAQLPAQKLPAPKAPSQQPVSPEGKKASAEPIKKPSTQKEESTLKLPAWIAPKNNTFIAKEFEIELLAYIFKHQDANNNEIITFFTQQIPSQLSTKNNIIKNIETTVKNISPEEPVTKPTPPAPSNVSNKDLPGWIDPKKIALRSDAFKDAALSYFANNSDADNDEIFNHFIDQLPSSYANNKVIQEKMKTIIARIFEG